MLKYVAEYPYKSDESLAVTEYNRYALSCAGGCEGNTTEGYGGGRFSTTIKDR